MAYKMKGFPYPGKSPAKQKKETKKVVGEGTDVIKTDKSGRDFTLSMYDTESGINQGDTLFVPKHIPKVDDEYVMGGDYEAEETKDSKKRKKGPKSYTLK